MVIKDNHYQRYVEFLKSKGVHFNEDHTVATYSSGLRFTVPTKDRTRYHSTTQQDIIPLSIRGNPIEDIFNLFLQELITSGKGLFERESSIDTYGDLFRQVCKEHQIRGAEDLQENLALWMCENFNVITNEGYKKELQKVFDKSKKRYEDLSREERIQFFDQKEIVILEPTHLLFVKAYPSKNSVRYGKFLFSMMARRNGEELDTSLLERIREYFRKEEHLDFESRLVLDFLKKHTSLELNPFSQYISSHLDPFCPSHANLLQDDIRALFYLEDKLERSYFIQLLYQVLSLHLITYVVRVLKAVRYWVKESRKQMQKGTTNSIEIIEQFRKPDYDLMTCQFSPNIKLYCGSTTSLTTKDSLFEDFHSDLKLLQASGMDIVYLDISRFLMREAKLAKRSDYPRLEEFNYAYMNDVNFKEFVEYSSGLMAAHYLQHVMLNDKDRKKSLYPHGSSKYWKVLTETFWQDIHDEDVSNYEVLISLIEKFNATRKTDRDTAFSWKMAYYRQFKEAGSIIQEIRRGNRSAVGYLVTDPFLTLTVHLAAIQHEGRLTLEQYESYLRKRGILIAENTKDSDLNRVELKKRLKELGMFETVSDSKEAQFINTIYI